MTNIHRSRQPNQSRGMGIPASFTPDQRKWAESILAELARLSATETVAPDQSLPDVIEIMSPRIDVDTANNKARFYMRRLIQGADGIQSRTTDILARELSIGGSGGIGGGTTNNYTILDGELVVMPTGWMS